MTITDFHNRHLGQRCFLLGSGPSLASMDLSGLKSEITFSCNRGYLLFEKLGFPTTYWALEDLLDYEQWGKGFEEFVGSIKFVADDIPFKGEYCKTPFVRDLACEKYSIEPPFYFGGTVMYMMLQLAAYMGCSSAYLLGNDFKWNKSHIMRKALVDDSYNEEEIEWITGSQDDNHFDKNYWPKGSRSFPPQPERMRKSFLNARRQGMSIVNVTPDSELDVFERADYYDVIKQNASIFPPDIPMEQHSKEISSLTKIVRAQSPVDVLEIGVHRGGTSALWHDLCSGLVIGIDDKINALEKRFPRFRSIYGKSQDTSVRCKVLELLTGKFLDFLFIDGDHSYQGVASDYAFYKTIVKPGGFIAFHDINADARHFSEAEAGGVPRFWHDLNMVDKIEITVHGDWGGIGVVRA